MWPGSGVHTDVLAARTTWAPGRSSAHGAACRPWPIGDLHQLVVGGVVLHLVDAMAVAVVGVQDRLIAVGQLTPALRLGAAGERAEFDDLVEAPLAALADQRLGEYRRRRGVVVLQRWDLVGDDVRVWHAADITVSRQPHKIRNDPR